MKNVHAPKVQRETNVSASSSNCVGMHNIKRGKYKKHVEMVLAHTKPDTDAKYEAVFYAGLPSLVSKHCAKKGVTKRKDGSLACNNCNKLIQTASSTNLSKNLKNLKT